MYSSSFAHRLPRAEAVDQSRCLPSSREVEVYFNIRKFDQRYLELRSTVEAALRECSHDD
jgi:hypothetical protein